MKYLHTMIRVTDLDRSLKFYCEALGFQITKRNEYPDEKFTLVFLRALGDDEQGPKIELTYNWETSKYEKGDAFGHLAYAVKSIDEVRARLRQHGFDLSWGPGKAPNGKSTLAFIDDPMVTKSN